MRSRPVAPWPSRSVDLRVAGSPQSSHQRPCVPLGFWLLWRGPPTHGERSVTGTAGGRRDHDGRAQSRLDPKGMPAGNRATTANRKIPGTHFGSWEVKGRIRRHLNVHHQAQGSPGLAEPSPMRISLLLPRWRSTTPRRLRYATSAAFEEVSDLPFAAVSVNLKWKPQAVGHADAHLFVH